MLQEKLLNRPKIGLNHDTVDYCFVGSPPAEHLHVRLNWMIYVIFHFTAQFQAIVTAVTITHRLNTRKRGRKMNFSIIVTLTCQYQLFMVRFKLQLFHSLPVHFLTAPLLRCQPVSSSHVDRVAAVAPEVALVTVLTLFFLFWNTGQTIKVWGFTSISSLDYTMIHCKLPLLSWKAGLIHIIMIN